VDRLDIAKLEHMAMSANKMADALVSLATTLPLGAEEDMTILICSHWVAPPNGEDSEEDVNVICVLETNTEH